MNQKDAEFLLKLRAAFKVEAEEHLQAISSGLIELEQAAAPERRREIVASIFREAHSLKGAARAVNAGEIESICQSLESVFSAWKRQEVRPTPELLDPLHAAVSAVGRVLGGGDTTQPGLTAEQIAELLGRLVNLESAGAAGGDEGREPPPAPSVTPPDGADAPPGFKGPAAGASSADVADERQATPGDGRGPRSAAGSQQHQPAPRADRKPGKGPTTVSPDTLRISAAKLDALLLRAEEMLAVKLTTNQRAADLRQALDLLEQWEKEWYKASSDVRTVRDHVDRRDAAGRQVAAAPGGDGVFVRLLEFLESSQVRVKLLADRLGALMNATDNDRRAAGAMVDALLEDSKKLLMLPFSTLFEALPKLVRELSRDQGKEVELVIRGGDVEIDKRILEEMKDPLIHLLRNAVDHGIEKPDKRALQNKPPRGTIHVAVSQVDGNKVEILIADDGEGIDAGQVREAAVRHGAISEEESRHLGEQESLGLIFRAEVSTSPVITEISGRGLGLPIVKEKTERLGGGVVVDTRPGGGTRFRLLLPLTLATFRGIMVRAAGEVFVIPTANVERAVRVKPEEVKSVENRETVSLNGRIVSLVRLDDVLGLSRPEASSAAYMPVVVVGSGDGRIAFRVDDVLNEQEVLVKRLGKPLSRVRNVAGATVLGSGRPVPILNVDDLMKSATSRAAAPTIGSAGAGAGAEVEKERKRLLVVEDSITARMLVKSILESAGYEVTTAVDGVDAMTALRTGAFDLVVSDVEMPRMNGFDLTAQIRADKRLADTPVVLVTALASREDRERGVDVGANAYIVKSSFDQSNLLGVVQRLL